MSWILLILLFGFGGFVCILMDRAKSQCHAGGCKQCGRCHRMREDAEQAAKAPSKNGKRTDHH